MQRGMVHGELSRLYLTEEPYFNTESVGLDEIRCYKVLVEIDGFPEDTNENTLCTTNDDAKNFSASFSQTEYGKRIEKTMNEMVNK